MTLGERLKLFAKERFGTLQAFGVEVGMTSGQLSNYTTGRVQPGTEILERFAGAGLNVHWLLTGRGEMDAPTTEKKEGAASGFIGFLTQEQIDQLQALLATARPAEEIKGEIKQREKSAKNT